MQASQGSMRRRWARGASASVAVLAVLSAGVAAAAPAVGAVHNASAASGRLVSLNAVSCTGSSWCMGVGTYQLRTGPRHALAQLWNGTSWRVLKDPPGRSLTSVSCSSPTFCMSAGGPTGTERWNGKTWAEMTSPARAVTTPSCGSRTLCMVINGADQDDVGAIAESWNGTRWRSWPQDTGACEGPPHLPCGLADVACGSAANCVAVGTTTVSQEPVQDTIGDFWNGKEWLGTATPGDAEGNPAALTAVSCAGSFCMAVGGAFAEDMDGSVAVAGTFDAATNSWTDVSPDLGVICGGLFEACSWAGAISCGSAANCLAFGGNNLAWNGTTWKASSTRSAGPGSTLDAAGCGGQICMAVGYRTIAGVRRTLAELWNGTSWKVLPTPSRT
jgi:hypothetical protein